MREVVAQIAKKETMKPMASQDRVLIGYGGRMRPMPFLLGAPFTCSRFVHEISDQTLDAIASPPITHESLCSRIDRSSGPYRGSRELYLQWRYLGPSRLR